MKIPFFSRTVLRRVVPATASPAAQQAAELLKKMLAGLPELQLGYVYDMQAQTLLASYTVSAALNPHHLTLRYARALRAVQQALADGTWPGECQDMTLVLDAQVHYLRPLPAQGWYCLLVSETATASLGLVKDVVRRVVGVG